MHSDYDDILDYVYGRMDAARRAAFDARMTANKALAVKVQTQLRLNATLDHVGPIEPRASAVARFWAIFGAARSRRLWRKILVPIVAPAAGIAAAVAVAVLLIFPGRKPGVPPSELTRERPMFANAIELFGGTATPDNAVPLGDPILNEALDLMDAPGAGDLAGVLPGEIEVASDLDALLALRGEVLRQR